MLVRGNNCVGWKIQTFWFQELISSVESKSEVFLREEAYFYVDRRSQICLWDEPSVLMGGAKCVEQRHQVSCWKQPSVLLGEATFLWEEPVVLVGGAKCIWW